MLYVLSRLFCAVFFKILFRFQVKGRENIPKTGRCILASNHSSFLDPPALAVASHRVVHFMAREGLFALPILGALLSRINVFPVKKAGAGIEAIRWALKRLAAGEIVAIFPEGGRSPDGALRTAQLGVGLLSFKSKTNIVPVYIKGSNLALPVHAKFIKLKKITLHFGPPLILDEIVGNDVEKKEIYQEIADALMERINRLKESS